MRKQKEKTLLITFNSSSFTLYNSSLEKKFPFNLVPATSSSVPSYREKCYFRYCLKWSVSDHGKITPNSTELSIRLLHLPKLSE